MTEQEHQSALFSVQELIQEKVDAHLRNRKNQLITSADRQQALTELEPIVQEQFAVKLAGLDNGVVKEAIIMALSYYAINN